MFLLNTSTGELPIIDIDFDEIDPIDIICGIIPEEPDQQEHHFQALSRWGDRRFTF